MRRCRDEHRLGCNPENPIHEPANVPAPETGSLGLFDADKWYRDSFLWAEKSLEREKEWKMKLKRERERERERERMRMRKRMRKRKRNRFVDDTDLEVDLLVNRFYAARGKWSEDDENNNQEEATLEQYYSFAKQMGLELDDRDFFPEEEDDEDEDEEEDDDEEDEDDDDPAAAASAFNDKQNNANPREGEKLVVSYDLLQGLIIQAFSGRIHPLRSISFAKYAFKFLSEPGADDYKARAKLVELFEFKRIRLVLFLAHHRAEIVAWSTGLIRPRAVDQVALGKRDEIEEEKNI